MPSSCRRFGPEPVRDQPPNTEPEQQQQHQQAISKPSTSALAAPPALALFVRVPLAPLLKTTDPYLSPAYLEDHRIKYRRLDFESGATMDLTGRKADPNAKQYTRLVPPQEMQEAVNKTQPWISPYCGTLETLHWDEGLDGWWHAYNIGDHLSMYLGSNKNGDIPGLIESTGWLELIPTSSYRLNCLSVKQLKWSVMRMWQREGPEPHVVCALSDKVPLSDNHISVPEMRTILTLSGMRVMDEGHGNHKVVPVTVISAAGKKLRVVVGIVDSENRSIELRVSKIIYFSEGVEKNWDTWMTVLGWIVGHPVGTSP